MFGLPIGVLFLSLLIFAMTKMNFVASFKLTLERIVKSFVGELLFFTIIFLTFEVSLCLGVMIRNFSNNGWLMYVSVSVSVCYILSLGATLAIYKVKKDDYMGEFSSFFRSQGFFSFYYIIHVAQRLLIGVLLGSLNGSYIPGIVAISILFAHCIFIAVFKPYSLNQENYRSILIMAGSIIILSTYLSLNILDTKAMTGIFIYSPLLVIILLIASIGGSTYSITYQILIMVRVYCDFTTTNKETNVIE